MEYKVPLDESGTATTLGLDDPRDVSDALDVRVLSELVDATAVAKGLVSVLDKEDVGVTLNVEDARALGGTMVVAAEEGAASRRLVGS